MKRFDRASAPPDVQSTGRRAAWSLISPAAGWLTVFFFVPLLIVFAVSFAARGTYGGIVWTLSFTNYLDLLHPLYGRIFLQSILFATAATAGCLALGFPLAQYIAKLPAGRQGIWLVLIMIPFWTNFLVRTYAWMFILRAEGLLNSTLQQLGLIQTPIEVLYTDGAVLLGLVYGYLPFMVLPLYVALERIDRSTIDAARDLYASRWAVFRRILLPLAKPGIVAGCILVFIPCLGAFITPDLLGGARSMMIGNLIQHEYLVVRDWPLGSALSFVLMLLVVGAMALYFRTEAKLIGQGRGA